MADCNRLDKLLRESKKYKEEYHYNQNCEYLVLHNRKITIDSRIRTAKTILIRKCKCKKYSDRSDLVDKEQFDIAELELDGVEYHTGSNCHYKSSHEKGCIYNYYWMQKVDYCSSEERSGLR